MKSFNNFISKVDFLNEKINPETYGNEIGINDKSESATYTKMELPASGPIGSILKSAYANLNVPTRGIEGTSYGNMGCAAAVSVIFYRATGFTIVPKKKIELGTSNLWRHMDSSNLWKKIPNWQTDSLPGDIILTSKGSKAGHVGVVVDGGKIISNSSGGFKGDKRGQVEMNYTISGWKSIAKRNPTKTASFRYIGPVKKEWGGEGVPQSNTTDAHVKMTGIVVFGGIKYATADWMRKQWTQAIGKPGSNVIFEEYNTSLDQVKKKYPNLHISALIGFSAGAIKVWPHINDTSIEFIGLIDPSINKDYVTKLPENTVMMSNSNNWTSLPKYAERIRAFEESGQSEYVKDRHKKIPRLFFKKYKDQILGIDQVKVLTDEEFEVDHQTSGSSDVLSYGSRGGDVTKVQQALLDWGNSKLNRDILPKYGADGLFYGETKKAVETYQTENNIAKTGIVDASLKSKLLGESGNGSSTIDNLSISKDRARAIYDGTTFLHVSGENGKTYSVVYDKTTKMFTAIPKSESQRNILLSSAANAKDKGYIYRENEKLKWKDAKGDVAEITNKFDHDFFESLFAHFETLGTGGSSSGGSFIDNSSANPSVTAKKGAQIAMRLMSDLSLTKEQAAGVVGNLWAESGLIPDRIQGRGMKRGTLPQAGGGGYGWAQYTHHSLKDDLRAFAKTKGIDLETTPMTDEFNYQYLIHWISKNSKKLSKLKSTSSTRGSAEYFVRQFEKPASIIDGTPAQQKETIDKRTGFANQVMAAMGAGQQNNQSTIASGSKPKVLFVGDSQTANSQSYANKLISSGKVQGKVIAKNGANTSTVLDMMSKELSSGEKYDYVSIMAGGNDGWRDRPDVPIKNLSSMYDIAKKSGAKVIAMSNPTKANTKKKFPANDQIAAFVEKKPSLVDIVIPVNTKFKSSSSFNSDMIHLNANTHNQIMNDWSSKVLV